MSDVTVLFDSNNLSAIPGLRVYDIDANQLPNRNLSVFKLARQNSSALTSAEYSDKAIYIYGVIEQRTRQTAEVTLATLRALIQSVEKTLTVPQYNRTVNYTATLQSSRERFIANNMETVLTFLASDPIGVDSVTEDLIESADQNITTSPETFDVTFDGTSIEQLPYITITINSLTDGEDGFVIVGNVETLNLVQINRNWEAGDVVTIDTINKEVRVNGTLTEYFGRMPSYLPGERQIFYSDTFSARDVDVEAIYQRRYA